MIPYLRVMYREYLPITAVFCGLVVMVLFIADFRETMVLPGAGVIDGLFIQWLLYALAVGFATSTWDEGMGTLAYVSHRGVSFERQSAWSHVVALSCLLAIVVVPLAIWGGLQRSFHPDAAAADWRRLVTIACVGTVTVAGYGVGFWCGALRFNLFVRLLVVVAAGAVVYAVGLDTMFPGRDEWSTPAFGFVGAQLVIGGAFLALGHHALREGRDPDRPLSTAGVLMQGGVVALVLSLAASDIVRSMQRTRQMVLHSRYPSTARLLESGRAPVFLSNDVPGIDGFALVDEEHEPLRVTKVEEEYEILFSPWSHWAHVKDPVWEREARDDREVIYGGVPFEGPYKRLYATEAIHAHLDLRRGTVRVVFLSADGRGPGEAVDLAPEGRRLSRGTKVLGKASRELPVLLLDDGRLWSLGITGRRPTLQPVSLPGGDRVVDGGTARGEVVAEGERGVYRYGERGFEPVDAEIAAKVRDGNVKDEAARALRLAQWESIDDPLRYEVAVTWDGDARRVAYEPKTAGEQSDVDLAVGLSMLRPPVLLLASLIRERPRSVVDRATFEDARWLDPLYAGEKRSSKVGLLFSVVVVLGLLVVVRLKKLGARPGHALAWLVVILAFGWAGYVVALAAGTRRAWRWETREFRAAEPPRIVTV